MRKILLAAASLIALATPSLAGYSIQTSIVGPAGTDFFAGAGQFQLGVTCSVSYISALNTQVKFMLPNSTGGPYIAHPLSVNPLGPTGPFKVISSTAVEVSCWGAYF